LPKFFLVQLSKLGFYKLVFENSYEYSNLTLKKDNIRRMISPNDIFIVYFTGKVPLFKNQIRGIYKVLTITKDRNIVSLKLIKEIKPIHLKDIKNEIKNKTLSSNFRYCGHQGFNITEISHSDFMNIYNTEENSKKELNHIFSRKEKFKEYFNKGNFNELNEYYDKLSDSNILYQYKNNLNELPNNYKNKFIKLEYIKQKKGTIIITKKGIIVLDKSF